MVSKTDPRFAKTQYLVRATGYEMGVLEDKAISLGLECHHMNPGIWREVGRIGGHFIRIVIWWMMIDGHQVCLFEGHSRAYDSHQVEAYLEQYLPEDCKRIRPSALAELINSWAECKV